MIKCFSVYALCFWALVLNGQTDFKPAPNKEQVEKQFKDASAKITSLKSDFIQEKHLEYLETTITSKGKFWFSKPNLMRWEYTDPFNYKIIINGNQLLIDDDGKKNQIDLNSNKAFKELNSVMMSSVNGELIGSEKFVVNMFENKEAFLVKLSPKNDQMRQVLSNIHMYISKVDNTVYKIKMIESEEDFTIINFTNRVTNAVIPANVFKTD